MANEDCRTLKIPKRLHQNQRPVNNNFADKNEFLFRWFNPKIEYESNGKLSAATIGEVFQPPNFISCNRSKFCKYSTDVLYNQIRLPHREGFGVIEAKVRDIDDCSFEFIFKKGMKGQENTAVIRLSLDHKPEKCMYPHSEIIILENGVKIKGSKPAPPTFRDAIRENIAPLFRVCHEPNESFRLVSRESLMSLIFKILFSPRLWKIILQTLPNNSNWRESANKILYKYSTKDSSEKK